MKPREASEQQRVDRARSCGGWSAGTFFNGVCGAGLGRLQEQSSCRGFNSSKGNSVMSAAAKNACKGKQKKKRKKGQNSVTGQGLQDLTPHDCEKAKHRIDVRSKRSATAACAGKFAMLSSDDIRNCTPAALHPYRRDPARGGLFEHHQREFHVPAIRAYRPLHWPDRIRSDSSKIAMHGVSLSDRGGYR